MYHKIFSLVVIKGLGIIASFLFLSLISVYISQEEIGVYGNLLAILNISVAILGLGSEKLIVRDFVSQDSFNYSLINSTVIAQFMVTVFIGIGSGLFITDISTIPLYIFVLAVLVTVIGRSLQRAVRLSGFPRTSLIIDILSIRFLLLLLGVIGWAFQFELTSKNLFVSFSFFSSLALIIYFLFYFIKNKENIYFSVNSLSIIYQNIKRGRYFWVNNIVSVAAKEIDIVVVFYLLGPVEAASFFIGRRLYNIMSVINQGSSFSFEQDFSGKDKTNANLKKLFQDLVKHTFVLGVCVFIVLLIALYLAEIYFGILEGVFYIGIIFMLGRMIENAIGPVDLYLNMRYQEFYIFKVTLFFLFMKLVIFFLVPGITIFYMAVVSSSVAVIAALVCLRKVNL
jgi:O-antigen/teichoic acid export membrane protein